VWFAASAPHHNIEAFMHAGLIPVERNEDFYLSVQHENARRCADIRRARARSLRHRSHQKPWRGSVYRTDVNNTVKDLVVIKQ
jgi:hypothetical protein